MVRLDLGLNQTDALVQTLPTYYLNQSTIQNYPTIFTLLGSVPK